MAQNRPKANFINIWNSIKIGYKSSSDIKSDFCFESGSFTRLLQNNIILPGIHFTVFYRNFYFFRLSYFVDFRNFSTFNFSNFNFFDVRFFQLSIFFNFLRRSIVSAFDFSTSDFIDFRHFADFRFSWLSIFLFSFFSILDYCRFFSRNCLSVILA